MASRTVRSPGISLAPTSPAPWRAGWCTALHLERYSRILGHIISCKFIHDTVQNQLFSVLSSVKSETVYVTLSANLVASGPTRLVEPLSGRHVDQNGVSVLMVWMIIYL